MAMRSLTACCVLGLAVLAGATNASAATIAFDSIGVDTSDSYNAEFFGNDPNVGVFSAAVGFVPQAAGSVTEIKMALVDSELPPSQYTISLCADDSGLPDSGLPGLPGSVLWTQTYDYASTPFSTPTTFTVANGPELALSTQYWVVASASGDGYGYWRQMPLPAGSGGYGVVAGSKNGGSWLTSYRPQDPVPGLTVSVAVPEPTTLGLLALPAFLALRRKHEQA